MMFIARKFYVYLIARRNLSWMSTSDMTNVKFVLLLDVDAEPSQFLRSSFQSYNGFAGSYLPCRQSTIPNDLGGL